MTAMAMNSLKSFFSWSFPIINVFRGKSSASELLELGKVIGLPVVGILLFLLLWAGLAPKVVTSLGAIPGPVQVWGQFELLVEEHNQERVKEAAFHERQDIRNEKKLESNPDAEIKVRPYTGAPTFFDQIWTSLVTVLSGFIIASLIAIPLGIISGLSKPIYSAINPLIQIFKPVSRVSVAADRHDGC